MGRIRVYLRFILLYYSIFRIPFIVLMILPFCPCIDIFIYLNSLNNNQDSFIIVFT